MAASTPAQGTPAISRQMPTMIAWMKATPMTPWATARMVWVASLENSAPRAPLPMTRPKIASLPRPPDWPKAMMMPAMMNEPMNCNRPTPMPATKPSMDFARSPILG